MYKLVKISELNVKRKKKRVLMHIWYHHDLRSILEYIVIVSN